LFIKENHFYIQGDTIQKLGEKTYAADAASVTTCKGDNPDWKITAKNVKVTMEGLGIADHATLWAKKVPVLYTPFMAFPTGKKRQTGLLFPEFATGDRKGFEYRQPFFWAINDNSDATFYFHHMQDRGEKFGAEYRYILSENTRGAIMADVLDDKEIDDGTAESSSNWGYDDDLYTRPNSDRYWIRAKHDQTLAYGIEAKIDIDIVSDQDYLTEFKQGHSGFDDTDDYFHENFGRDLDDYDDPVRLNRINLNKNWSRLSLNAEARWWDDVINRRLNDTNTILQKLPFVELDAPKQQLFKTPLYADLNSEYVHFYREDREKAHRVDVYPRLYLPLHFSYYLAFEPSIGYRQTYWKVNDDRSGNSVDESDFRDIYDLKADFSSEIYRIFRVQKAGIQAMKHTVRPQLIWNFIPDEDQSDLPQFDGTDRIGKINTLTYSIINTLTTKSQRARTEANQTQQTNQALSNNFNYHEFLRLKLEQTYDIEKDEEPFLPLLTELNFTPSTYFSMKADARFSYYDRLLASHNIAGTIRDKRGDQLFLEHRYNAENSESLYFDLRVKITDALLAYAEHEQDLFDDKEIKTGLGVLYKTGCWSINCFYTKEDNDHRYGFVARLVGLGEFSKSFAEPSIQDPVEYD